MTETTIKVVMDVVIHHEDDDDCVGPSLQDRLIEIFDEEIENNDDGNIQHVTITKLDVQKQAAIA